MYHHRPLDPRITLALAMVACWMGLLASPGSAFAVGTYTVTVPATSGWPGWTSPLLGGPFRVDNMRVATRGGTWDAGEYRRWHLTAPGTTRIAGGRVIGRATTSSTGMVAQIREGSDGGAVRVVWSSSDDRQFDVPLSKGNDWMEFGLIAAAHATAATADTNSITVESLSIDVFDDAAPVAVATSEPDPRTWYGPAQCAPWNYSATDTGSGITRTTLNNTTADINIAQWETRPRPGLAPGYLSISRAGCLDSTHAVHGLNRLTLTFRDAGQRMSVNPMTAMFDLHAPTITETQPNESLEFDTPTPVTTVTAIDSDSGIDRVTAAIDDIPAHQTIHGTDVTIEPAGPLPIGSHTVTITATDRAGNQSQFVRTLTVVDHTPPTLRLTSPGDHGGASPWIAAAATDAGSGIDPSGWTISVDGVRSEIVSANDAIAGPLGMLTPGTHRIDVSITDGAGNIANLSHTYIVDVVPGVSQAAAPGGASGAFLQQPLNRSYAFGAPIYLRILAAQSGRPLAGYRLVLRRGSTTIADAITDVQGIGIIHTRAERAGTFTVTVPGVSIPSRAIHINVRPRITLRSSTHHPHAGTDIRISGSATPVPAGTRAHLYAQIDGSWYPLRRTVTMDAHGHYSGTVTSAVRGVIALQARIPIRNGWSEGISNTLILHVT